jgi:hypothetical protein
MLHNSISNVDAMLLAFTHRTFTRGAVVKASSSRKVKLDPSPNRSQLGERIGIFLEGQ